MRSVSSFFSQNTAADQRAFDLCIIKLHQLNPDRIAFDHPETMRDGLQRRHPFRSALGAQLKRRMVRGADLHPGQLF